MQAPREISDLQQKKSQEEARELPPGIQAGLDVCVDRLINCVDEALEKAKMDRDRAA